MKNSLLAGAALAGLIAAGAASAADLPRRTAPVAFAPAAIPVFTWTGFYVGVNAGYGWGQGNDRTLFVPPGTFPGGLPGGTIAFGGGRNDGFVGGGQLGYNYQFGQFVVGVEGDLQYADLDRGNGAFVLTPPGGFPAGFTAVQQNRGVDWFGTARARLGVAFDRALIYGTGGLAFGDGGKSPCAGLAFNCGSDDTRFGWTLGGGLEYALTNNITAKIEGLYVNLDRAKNGGLVGFNAAGTAFTAAGVRAQDNDFAVVRAGVNYKF